MLEIPKSLTCLGGMRYIAYEELTPVLKSSALTYGFWINLISYDKRYIAYEELTPSCLLSAYNSSKEMRYIAYEELTQIIESYSVNSN